MLLDEELFETNKSKLSFREFINYLASIGNSYHAFSRVKGTKGSGYRYTLSKPLTQEQKDHLSQYSNVDFGTAQYKYAPEIKYNTIILLDRMNKVEEDIEKTKSGKWVNRGKEGTHGEFKTKKQAREQQKAMFARGFRENVELGTKSKKSKEEMIKFLTTLKEKKAKTEKPLDESIDYSTEDYLLKPYWYFTTHGVMPGSIPKSVKAIWTSFDVDSGSYFATDSIIETNDLQEFEIKEQTPNVEDIPEKSRIDIQKWLSDSSLKEKVENSTEEIKESVEDETTSDNEQLSETALSTLVSALITSELQTVDDYNSAIVNFETENKSEYTNILRDIIKEEQNHIGQLQKILDGLKAGTIQNIEDGQEEATRQLD